MSSTHAIQYLPARLVSNAFKVDVDQPSTSKITTTITAATVKPRIAAAQSSSLQATVNPSLTRHNVQPLVTAYGTDNQLVQLWNNAQLIPLSGNVQLGIYWTNQTTNKDVFGVLCRANASWFRLTPLEERAAFSTMTKRAATASCSFTSNTDFYIAISIPDLFFVKIATDLEILPFPASAECSNILDPYYFTSYYDDKYQYY